ncbi:MAG: nucleotidyltransferase family protein [Candidatus Omnitrophica bacterium]|nr:nucleotidyltransferase family protein [Candidatus Omnitrophota bacterium]
MNSIVKKIGLKTKILKSLLKEYKVKRIALFGSCVTGRLNKGSDLDFLVEFEKEADLLDQVGLKQDLEAVLHRKVDVVTPQALSKYFRSQVLGEAVYL